MSTALARRFKADISVDGTTWIPIKGIQDFAHTEKPTIQSVADYDNAGFDSFEKTLTAWDVTIKARRVTTTGVFDPGQQIAWANQYQFSDAARSYIRWYDRNGAAEAFSGRAIVTWVQSKTATADVEEVTITFQGDGLLSPITNPSTAPQVPVILTATPSGVAAAGLVRITGAYFTGTIATTGVKFLAVNATSWDVISDSLIEAVMPTGTAGSAPITVTNGSGASATLPYTRA